MATTANSHPHATAARARVCPISDPPPIGAEVGGLLAERTEVDGDREQGSEAHERQDSAGESPVVVACRAECGGERLARAELDEEDRVVTHEQADAGQRPEGDRTPEDR